MVNFIITSEVHALLGYTVTYTASIQTWLPYMPGRVCAICNNYFKSDQAYVNGGDYVFDATAGTITTTEESFTADGNFVASADIYIHGSLKNDGFIHISTVTSTVITINASSEYGITTLVDENIDTEDLRDVYLWFVMFPKELKPIVANMVRYDMLDRANKKGVQSERIGNYSVAYSRAAQLGYNYPDDVIGGLDQFINPVVG